MESIWFGDRFKLVVVFPGAAAVVWSMLPRVCSRASPVFQGSTYELRTSTMDQTCSQKILLEFFLLHGRTPYSHAFALNSSEALLSDRFSMVLPLAAQNEHAESSAMRKSWDLDKFGSIAALHLDRQHVGSFFH